MSKDYAEILLQAVDTLYNKRVESIKFDTTDSATIVEVADAAQGKYIVSTGATRYVAYSVNTTYRVGDRVYVTIPNGDYEQQKIIIGKQVTDNSQPFVYTAPFDTIVNISENLIPSTADVRGGLRANCYYDQLNDNPPADAWTVDVVNEVEVKRLSEELEKPIWEQDFDKENLIGYTRLGIQAQFMSWLYHWRVISGEYGLKLVLTYRIKNCESYLQNYNETLYKLNSIPEYNNQEDKTNDWNWIINNSFIPIEDKVYSDNNREKLIAKTEELLSNLQGQRSLFFRSSDFYGDPYNFNTYFQQEAVFDISSLGEEAQITKMQLYFYQIPGTFFKQSEEPVPYRPENSPFGDAETGLIDPNLFVKDPYICLGFGVGEFSEDSLNLYTIDSLTYSYTIPDDYTEEDWLRKTLQLRWIHEYPDGTISEVKNTGNNENLPQLNYEIRWYRYELGAPAPDPYAGVYWKRIERGIYGSQSFSYEVSGDNRLRNNLAEEKFKVIILLFSKDPSGTDYCTDIYRSNTLTFTNEDQVVSQVVLDQITGYFLQTNDASDGNYFIYGQSGHIKEQPDSKQIRQLQCYFRPNNKSTAELLASATKIVWRFPASNTMLNLADMYISPLGESGWLDGAERTRNIDTVEWELAPSFTVNEYGLGSQNYEIQTVGESKGQVNSGVVYHVAWSKVCYDAQTDEYVIGYKGDPGFAYFINPAISYTISSEYVASFTNNTISCTIEKNGITYNIYKTMRFGPAGTNGSAHTLAVTFDDTDNSSYVLTETLERKEGEEEEPKETIHVSAHLYDENKREEFNYNGTYYWRWLYPTDKVMIRPDETAANNTNNSKIILEHNNNAGLQDNLLLYLECKLDNFGAYDLITIIPIAVRSDKSYVMKSGPTQVTYKTTGYPQYYTGPYTMQQRIEGNNGWQNITNGEWEIYNPYNVLDNFCGTITTPNNTLKPCGIYVKEAGQYGVQYKIDDAVVWTQPIYCCINEYPSSTLNQWDGKSIEIDEENGSIVAPAIAAGKKNTDNTFSGVMMGDWRRTDTEESLTEQTGIYGLNHGSVSYAFMEDGTAFIGKSGMGRIHFDGDNSTIQSEAFQQNAGGMSIDLDDGIIDIQGTIKTGNNGKNKIGNWNGDTNLDGKGYYESENTYMESGSQVKIQATDPYFIVKTENYENNTGGTRGNEIIHIGAGKYFLQSDDWSEGGDNSTSYVAVDSSEVNRTNYTNYFIKTASDVYQRDDNSVITPGRSYYIYDSQTSSYDGVSVFEYKKNKFYTHYILDIVNYASDSEETYDNNRQYYILNEETGKFNRVNLIVNHYEPNTYYWRDYLGYRLATGDYDSEETYYTKESDEVFTPTSMVDISKYSKNTYYYLDNGVYTLDEYETPTEGREYYEQSVLYEGFKVAELDPITYDSIYGKYILQSDTYSNLNDQYSAFVAYYLYDGNTYNVVPVNPQNHYSITSLTQYCTYDNNTNTYTIIYSSESNNQIIGGVEYYLQEPVYEGNILNYNYSYVGYLYVPNTYYTVENGTFQEITINEDYNPNSGQIYYDYDIENNRYIQLTEKDFLNPPTDFEDKQANGELYRQSYSQTDLEYREDIDFYDGNYELIPKDKNIFDTYSVHYIKTYYLNTNPVWDSTITYYEKNSENNIYQYEPIELYIITYQPNIYYIQDNTSKTEYVDRLITLNDDEFLQAINNDSSPYIFDKNNDGGIISVYLLDNNENTVLVYYNDYAPNIYYYKGTGYGLYKGDTYYDGPYEQNEDPYEYFYNKVGGKCYFYVPEVFYYTTPGYIQAPTYDEGLTYYKISRASGTKIDINNGEIKSYKLKLIGYDIVNIDNSEITRNIEINSQHITYPLKIGIRSDAAGTTETFKVDWNGKLWSTSANIGGWQVTSDAIVSSGYDVTKPKNQQTNKYIYLNSNGSIEANYNDKNGTGWKIDQDGNAYFYTGKIGSWDIRSRFLASNLNESNWTADTWLFATDQTEARKIPYKIDSKGNNVLSSGDTYTKQWRLLIGNSSGNTYNFGVNKNGEVIAKKIWIPNNALYIDGTQVTIKQVTIPVSFNVVAVGAYVEASYPRSIVLGDIVKQLGVTNLLGQTSWATWLTRYSYTGDISGTWYQKSGSSYVQRTPHYTVEAKLTDFIGPYKLMDSYRTVTVGKEYVWNSTAGGYKTYITQVVKGKILSGINGLAIEDLPSWYLLNSSNNKYGLVQNGNTWSPGEDWNKVKLLGYNIEPKNVYIDGLTVMDNYS